MSDTKNYLRQLKKTLPNVRERLIAVVVLLAMSVTMMISATFAWLVLSGSPEVQGMSLSISGNGSLEIALRTDNTMQPGSPQIGDSVAAGNSMMNANITWGNLINLSEGYGLDTLVLRPARLNEGGLIHGKPLEGVAYDSDGRIVGMQSDYAFTVWKVGEAGGAFVKPDVENTGYGVRAISSMTYTYEGESALQLKKYQENATTANGNAMTAHRTITADDGPYMATIVSLMGDYMGWTVGSADYPNPEDKDCSNYIVPLVWMIRDMIDGLEQHGQALVYIVNAWQYNEQQTQFMTYEELLAGQFHGFDAKDAQGEYVYPGYAVWKADYDMFKSTLTGLNGCLTYLTNTYGEIEERQGNMQPWPIEGAYWAQIENTVVNKLIKISTCEVMDKNGENRLPVKQIGKDEALKYTNGVNTAVIMEGYLVNYEHLTGEEMLVGGETPLTITVKIPEDYQWLLGGKKTIDISSRVITKRAETNDPDHFQLNYNELDAYLADNMKVSDAVAGDTFGLVLDLWARTNMPGSILTLNGTIITRQETQDIKEIIEGVSYQIYTWKPADAGESEEPMRLYQKGTTWYNLEDHKPVDVGTVEPIALKKTVDVVVEYTGDNRVWDEDQLLISDGALSTTQGNGSCYIYYADSPEAGMKSLELLKNLKIAFITGDNKYLATASMDTAHALQENGKYTVPLVITDSQCSYMDEDGNLVKGITALNPNEATMISAIVYLDGEALKNEHVLAAADIQGSLNLQFKSSAPLNPIADRELMDDEISVSAMFTGNTTELSYEYRYPFNQEVEVNLQVTGFTPTNAEAFFQRKISETQGSRMESFPIDLTTGKGTATFTSPGSYILRYVRLDGVEYELTEPLTVEVSGFAVASVSVGKNYFMTADKSATTSVSVGFGALDADELPRTVQARFLTESGGAINVKLHSNPNGLWTGNVTFNSSGIYTLDYLVLDGEYSELNDDQKCVVEARLGMSTEVILRRYDDEGNLTNNLKFTLESGQTARFKAFVKIKDDSGTYLTNLDTGAPGALKLYYKTTGSVGTVDADLKWDEDYGGYVTESQGFFIQIPGTYRFAQVVVDGNSITNAYPSPVINAMYPDPPTWAPEQYYESNVVEVFAPNSDGRVTVYVTNAGTEKLWMVFKDETGKYYDPVQVVNPETDIQEVCDADGNLLAHSYTVTLPTGADGTQKGTWTLVALQMADVNDGKGGVATTDEPYVLALTEEEQLQFKVSVDDFTLVFNEENNITQESFEISGGTFMEGKPLSSTTLYPWLIQTGGNGENKYAVTGSTLKLYFSYQRYDGVRDLMDEYGGYTTNGTPTVEDVVVELKAMNEQGRQFYQITDGGTFMVAGKYVLSKAELTVPGKDGADRTYVHVIGATEGNNLGIVMDTNRPESILPEIHVKTSKPTVKVSAVSGRSDNYRVLTLPDPMKLTDYDADDVPNMVVDNSKTDYSATVYIMHTKDTTLLWTYWNSHLPSVKLTLSSISDNFTSASMVFPHTNRSYAANDAKFSFTPGSWDSTASIGYDVPVSGSSDNFYPAGRAIVSQIQVTTADGTVYDVDLTHEVTINQPQYPYVATFNAKDGNGVALNSKPGDLMATPNANGDLAIKLPGSQTWTVEMKENISSGDPTTYPKTVYLYEDSTWTETESNGCGGTNVVEKTGYTNYTVTANVAESSTTTEYWNRTYTISKWIINGQEYNPGDEVVLTSNVTITALLTHTDGTVTTKQTTTKVYTVNSVDDIATEQLTSQGEKVESEPKAGDYLWTEIS